MRKRQFGTGRLIYASDHNTAENYAELNTKEIAVDGGIRGIISGGALSPHNTLEYTIVLNPTIARTLVGERCVVPEDTNIFIKPSVDPGSGNEVYITAYIEYSYQLGEVDIDGNGLAYYKDYQNSFTISTVQGVIATSGSALTPSIPTNAVLLCDVLYNSSLYGTGQIKQSDIDVSRQDRFDNRAIVNLKVTGTAEFQQNAVFRDGIDMALTNFTHLSDPTNGGNVGDRDYNDNRYVKAAGDTMTGTLNVPDINVSSSMTIQNLQVNGTLHADQESVFNDDVNISGDLSVNAGSASIGKDLTVLGVTDSKSILIPWDQLTTYDVGEVIVYEDSIYKCTTAHTSTSNFLNDISNWEAIGGGGGTTHRVHLVAHGFTVGDVLRYDTNTSPNGYVKALANDPDTLGQFVVIRILDADNFIISSGGYFEDLTYTINLIPNQWYYTSDTIPGQLTTSEPQFSNPVLYSITANKAFVFVYRPAVGAVLHVDEFTATLGQKKFPLSKIPVHNDYVLVSVDGIIQSSDKYSFFSSTGIVSGIEFNGAMNGGEEVRVQLINNILRQPGASMDTDTFVVTSTGETQFTMSYEPISQSFIIVSIDGALQHHSAFSTSGKTLTFSSGLTAGSEVQVIHILNLNAYVIPDPLEVLEIQPKTGHTDITIDTSSGKTIIKGDIDNTGSLLTNSGITSGGDILLTESNDLVLSSTGAIYVGDPVEDNTWRIVRVGDNLSFQRRESGAYNQKWTITP